MDPSRFSLVPPIGAVANLPPARIYVCDPDPSRLGAMRHLLASRGHAVHAFQNEESFVAEHDPVAHGCVIVDATTLAAAGPQLRQGSPHKPIIVSTPDATLSSAVQQMRSGAFDVLVRPIDDAALVAAVEAALEEDRTLVRRRAQHAVNERRLATLTRREHEVLRLMMCGLLNKQIASNLGTALKTVKVHRGRVMQKMNVRTIVDLTRLMERTFPHFEVVATNTDSAGRRRGGREAGAEARTKVDLDGWRARSLRAGP